MGIGIIHALGNANRREYIQALVDRHFPLSTTINPRFSGWADWNLRASWEYYRQLYTRYEPFAESGQHIFWRRRITSPAAGHPLRCQLFISNTGFADIVVDDPDQMLGDGVWLAEIKLDISPTTIPAGIWRIEEVDTPLRRPGRDNPERWVGFPWYGISFAGQTTLVVGITRSLASRLALSTVKTIHNNAKKIAGHCSATTLMADPVASMLAPLSDASLNAAIMRALR